jgi:hypothetical protein
MSRLTRRPRLLLVAVALLVGLLAGGGVVYAATVKSGKAVTAIKVATESAATQILTDGTSYGAWTDIAGMSLNISVPSSQKALLLITFSAQTYCFDGFGSGATTLCKVRVLVNRTTALPGDVVFESAADGNGGSTAETNSMQFVAGPISAGSYTIKVQALVDETWSNFTLMSRTLSVLRSRVP